MITIAPSILSADFAHLGRDIQRISDADYVHGMSSGSGKRTGSMWM